MAKAPKARGKAAGRRLGAEEADLWRQVMNGVQPLVDKEEFITDDIDDTASEPVPGRRRSGPGVGGPAATSLPRPPDLPPLAHGATPGVDKRTAARLKRGQLPIEARIDLHGLTREEAHRALAVFLADSQETGKRCVLVITGKGRRRGGEDGADTGVLRNAVPRWLNEAPNRRRVLALAHALPRDGGEGALYLLLRKNR